MLLALRFWTQSEYQISQDKAGRGWLVEKAFDTNHSRYVVLKSVPANRAEEVRELRQEEAMLARIRSEHVVSTFGLVSARTPARGKRLYLVIEHFSADTLRNLVEDRHGNRLDLDRALQIVISLLKAFEALHAAGILHRDLHYSHVSYRDRNHLKLFDLAASLSNFGVPNPLSLRNVHANGTWETMAPEEFRLSDRITAAANVYSAGTLLYRLLAGRYPLAYKDYLARWESYSPETQKAYQYDLHLREAVHYPDFLKPRVVACLRRALSKRADDRYQSARAFRADLESVLHNRTHVSKR